MLAISIIDPSGPCLKLILNCKMGAWKFALREKQSPPSSSGGSCDHGTADGDPLRCTCGNMLARYVAGGVELKCRRCKRKVIVPVEGEPIESPTG